MKNNTKKINRSSSGISSLSEECISLKRFDFETEHSPGEENEIVMNKLQ